MVVTKAPSEPFPIVRRTLEAMLAQRYPHDTWLADEDPSAETLAWCENHGVRVSTRKGRADYHLQTWPRRTRCKEGNLAFFYDHYGYDGYDFVAQLDADHVPEDGYLEEMLRPFADPAIGYVSAPSICDANADASWSARGRLNFEGPFHGALQAGYAGSGLAPMCIGSHYAVRTAALREIGGLGPELAEDHSTSLLMNAGGWRGVHAMAAIARGDGPSTFADMVTQEFQWSRSLITILLAYMPTHARRLPRGLRIHFLFCQSSYVLLSLFMSIAFMMPLVALFVDRPFVNVSYPEFFISYSLISAGLIAMLMWWRKEGWTRPSEAPTLSWEGMLYMFARWPWWIIGTAAAVRDRISGTVAEFRITPKGASATATVPFRVIAPYLALSFASGLPVLFISGVRMAPGFYFFALLNAVIYAALSIVILVRHNIENRSAARSFTPVRHRVLRAAVMASLVAVPIAGAVLRAPAAFSSLLYGADRLVDLGPGAETRVSNRPRAETTLQARSAATSPRGSMQTTD
jgi:hypothetical protein